MGKDIEDNQFFNEFWNANPGAGASDWLYNEFYTWLENKLVEARREINELRKNIEQTKPVNNKMRGFHGWRDEFGNELICPVKKQLLEVKRVAANYGIDFKNITDNGNDLIETLINDELSESIIKLKNIYSENIIETKRIAEAMRGVFNFYKKTK